MEKIYVYTNTDGNLVTDTKIVAAAVGCKSYNLCEVLDRSKTLVKGEDFFERHYTIGKVRDLVYYEMTFKCVEYIFNACRKFGKDKSVLSDIKAEFWDSREYKPHVEGVQITKVPKEQTYDLKGVMDTLFDMRKNISDPEVLDVVVLSLRLLDGIDNKRIARDMQRKLSEVEGILSEHLQEKEQAPITEIVKEMSEREKILKTIDDICEKTGFTHKHVYARIYNDLYMQGFYLTGEGYDSKIQEAEARGLLGRIKSIISKAFNV